MSAGQPADAKNDADFSDEKAISEGDRATDRYFLHRTPGRENADH
jgi:hypothetical protein